MSPCHTHQHGVLSLQGGTGAGFTTHAAQDKKVEDSQTKLRHAQSSLERWQQTLGDLIASTSGRLDADTVRSVPAHTPSYLPRLGLEHLLAQKLLLCGYIYGKRAVMNKR